jgi:hypothetical protein
MMRDALKLVNTEFYKAHRVDTAGFKPLFYQPRITSVSDDRTHGAKVAIQFVEGSTLRKTAMLGSLGVGSRTMREHLPIKKRRTICNVRWRKHMNTQFWNTPRGSGAAIEIIMWSLERLIPYAGNARNNADAIDRARSFAQLKPSELGSPPKR